MAAAVVCAVLLLATWLALGRGPRGTGPVGEGASPAVGGAVGAAGDSAPLGPVPSGTVVSHEREGHVAEVAADVVREYCSRGDCVVARAGCLDLLGRTWGCVMQGAGWVELCVVREVDDGGCVVSVARIEASEVRALMGPLSEAG